MIGKKALRRVYHFVRGTARPNVAVVGAYPVDGETFALRFETSALKGVADSSEVRVTAEGLDEDRRCIELRRLDFVRGGMDLVKATYSVALRYRFGTAQVSLVDRNGRQLAGLALTERRARGLLDAFERMACDAGADPTYDAAVAAPMGAEERVGGGETFVDVAIVAGKCRAGDVLDTLESLCAQEHRAWRAWIVAGGAAYPRAEEMTALVGDSRVRAVGSRDAPLAQALNRAIAGATGTGMLFLRAGDVLAPGTLALFAEALDGGCTMAYCDVDLVGARGETPSSPQFKPEFNLDMLYSRNYIDDAFAIRAAALASMGERPVTLDGAWSWELALKAAEVAGGTRLAADRAPTGPADITDFANMPHEAGLAGAADDAEETEAAGAASLPGIVHIARVGCHVRARAAHEADPDQDIAALEAHFGRRGAEALVERTGRAGVYRTTFPIRGDEPLVSIIIPNKDHIDYLEPCIASIRDKAGYESFEVIVVENNSASADTFAYYERIEREDGRVRVVDFTKSELNDGTFNYARLINFGVRASRGELLLLLNNDTQAITEGFLAILAGYCLRPEVGVVGALLRHADGLVQHAGIALLSTKRPGFMNQHLSPELRGGYLNSLACAADCSCVLGACQMVRRETFAAVGGYEEALAITGNDMDFCWKVRELGLLVVFTPHAQLYHKEFGSRRSDVADVAQEEQSMREAEFVIGRWPRYYREGDGFINPNLDQESIYYRLRDS